MVRQPCVDRRKYPAEEHADVLCKRDIEDSRKVVVSLLYGKSPKRVVRAKGHDQHLGGGVEELFDASESPGRGVSGDARVHCVDFVPLGGKHLLKLRGKRLAGQQAVTGGQAVTQKRNADRGGTRTERVDTASMSDAVNEFGELTSRTASNAEPAK